jgi:hypothetical protein
MEAPTTEELLDDAEARTGLARGQLLMMVAKSATVRHLACHPDYREKVADLVRRKFNVEGRSQRYATVGIRRPADLVRTFADAGKLRSLREDWEQLVGSELLFLPSERAKPPTQTLTNSQNVERICLEFWQPTLDLLLSTRMLGQ